MNIVKVSKVEIKDHIGLFNCINKSLYKMIKLRGLEMLECFIEWRDGTLFKGDFRDLGITALSEDVMVYVNPKCLNEEVFYFSYDHIECLFIDEDIKGDIKRVRVKFKDVRVTFRYKYVNYNEYIKSDEWKYKRKEVLERDGFKCRLCGAMGSGYSLHVHHNSYDNLGNEPLEDLITLCKECHERHHGRKIVEHLAEKNI